MYQFLIEQAEAMLGEFQLARPGLTAGSVGCALSTASGKVYTGICLDLACGIGFCAEHAAIAEMLKTRETVVDLIVAVSARGILMPCGRCRELLAQVCRANLDTKVVVDSMNHIRLSDLLPRPWV